MPVRIPIVLTEEDFDEITEQGALCDASGEVGLVEFEEILRRQLKLYVQVMFK